MLRMSSYAGQSLRSGAFICTPCRLLLARRAAIVPLAAQLPRLLNSSRLRTYSDEATATPAASTSSQPPSSIPKKKKKKKKAAKPEAATTNDRVTTTEDISLIQEALNKIKSVIYGAGQGDQEPSLGAPMDQEPKSEQPKKTKKGGKGGARKLVRKVPWAADRSQGARQSSEISEADRAEGSPAANTPKASQQHGVHGKATTTPAASKANTKQKISPFLAHLSPQPEEEANQGHVKKKKKQAARIVPDIVSVHGRDLGLLPIERAQPPVPGLSYGLDRVLFNPGVYQLQDPRSRVYNFDPYLAGIMPVKEFDFDALKQYVTSSKDTTLIKVAAEQGKKYAGSTSSMTSMLAHFHYLLSSWRPINTDHLSRSFPVESTNFTMIQRSPAAIFLHWKDGTYAIDADKEFDTANVLSMLGKSMEKLLTLPKGDFEKYRRVNSSQLTEEERNADESYHYTTMGDLMMRSQLDAHDDRLPKTGMFDLKTRAVVSIRMDAQDYQNGVGYEIRKRFGQWESYEREYYDMIRSAFLKYSLQVRMGRMDGIFVAFHNTERIFGFQYISLSEMDQSLHGSSNTTLGDLEFKFSLHLLNKVLDKATKKWPGQSLRLHFETRPPPTAFMYIFAKPVTAEQIEKVQTKNKAEVERFEREMMGLVRDGEREGASASLGAEEEAKEEEEEDVEEEEGGEETSLDVWEDMRTKVEETLENDELGADFVRDVMEDALEESGLFRTRNQDEKERYLDAIMEVITIGSQAKRGEEDRGNVTTGEVSMTHEGSVEDTKIAAESKPVATPEPESFADKGQDKAPEAVNGSEDAVQESKPSDEAVKAKDADIDMQEASLKNLIIRLASKSRASSTIGQGEVSRESDDDLSSDEQRLRTFERILYDMVEKTHEMKASAGEEPSSAEADTSDVATTESTSASGPGPMPDETESLLDGEDAAPETVDSEIPHDGEVLGMILTLRNKVNGQYVSRPSRITQSTNWTVEYAIEELPSVRAVTLYEKCIARRHKALGKKAVKRKEFDERYRKNLQDLSDAGRAWREKEVQRAKEKPVHVYGLKESLKWEDVFNETGEPMPESKVDN